MKYIRKNLANFFLKLAILFNKRIGLIHDLIYDDNNLNCETNSVIISVPFDTDPLISLQYGSDLILNLFHSQLSNSDLKYKNYVVAKKIYRSEDKLFIELEEEIYFKHVTMSPEAKKEALELISNNDLKCLKFLL